MNPLQISAQYAAYLWFNNQDENAGKTRDEAREFSRRNWEEFLPNAHQGFGRLLLQIASPSEPAIRMRRPVLRRPRQVAASA